jgi:hypothetical protein
MNFIYGIEAEVKTGWMMAGGVALSVIFIGPMASTYMASWPLVGSMSPDTRLGIFAGLSALAVDFTIRTMAPTPSSA